MKQLLITQAERLNTPYRAIANQHGWRIHFQPFIETKPIWSASMDAKHILTHNALVFTSARALTYFFQHIQKKHILLPSTMKYFCISHSLAKKLQAHLGTKPTHLYIGNGSAQSVLPLLANHPHAPFLYPCAPQRMDTIVTFLRQRRIPYTEWHLYETQAANLAALSIHKYNIVVFFSPSAVNALVLHHKELIQGDCCFIAFGPTTAQALQKAGWTPNLVPQNTTINALAHTLAHRMNQLNVNNGHTHIHMNPKNN